jgi:hypothetical protein
MQINITKIQIKHCTPPFMNYINKQFFIGLLTVILLIVKSITSFAQEHRSIAGTWQFKIDSSDVGVQQKWYASKLAETVKLPGSMLENDKGYPVTLKTKWTGSIYDSSWYFNPRLAKYRQPNNLKFPFWLTPAKTYVGAAWYQKEVTISPTWKNKHIELFLERPHTETRVWIDNQEIGMQNSMVVAHQFDLSTYLTVGKHTITIRIDNRMKDIIVGQDSHSLTDHTQGNWNGIVGKMELIATNNMWYDDIQIYPNLKAKSAKVVIILKNDFNKVSKASISLGAKSFNSPIKQDIKPLVQSITLDSAQKTIVIDYPMGDNFQTWDEFNPALYNLTISASSPQGNVSQTVSFGMRDFKIKGTLFEVNGRPTMLRGNVENCQFPLTGYAPMDTEAWVRVFKKAKDYGLNHFRFHSYCPPEAAFKAADLVGFYLQPEGPSWANHGSSLGDGKPIDQYIYDETNRMAKIYGNYASFCMLAYGNEPKGGRQAEWLGKFCRYWQAKDHRRVYTGASVAMSWPIVPENDYMIKSGARGLPWGKLPATNGDYRAAIEKYTMPYVTHEMGQWCVYPNFEEIPKYKGVYKAKNFELFQEDLQDRGMVEQGHDFKMASGKLQILGYKTELEASFRTVGLGGFQLLSANDYSGQGTALVGFLDPFWDEKGYIDAKSFRRYCNSTVTLIRTDKFVYTNNETLKANVEVSHFGKEDLKNVTVLWTLKNIKGEIVAKGQFDKQNFVIGTLSKVGEISANINAIQTASKLSLEVSIANTEYANDWDFWVYPQSLPTVSTEGIYVTDSLNAKAQEILANGGKVLISAAGKIEKGKEIINYLQPAFWNTSWFKMRPPHTTGFLTNPSHPALANFPTEYHSNLQWWELVHKAQVMHLEDFPSNIRPIVQPIDTWFMNRRLAMVMEVKVGKGKLLISSLDLLSDPSKRFVARQLLYSLEQYMNSDKFNPSIEVDVNTVQKLFTEKSKEVWKSYSKDSPDELKPTNLHKPTK